MYEKSVSSKDLFLCKGSKYEKENILIFLFGLPNDFRLLLKKNLLSICWINQSISYVYE